MVTINEISEAPGRIGTTYFLSYGDSFLGNISAPLDSDWLETRLEAGHGYYATLSGDGSSNSLSDSELFLRDSRGREIGTDRGSTATVALSPTADGVFYLDAQGQFTSSTGTYRLDLFREVSNTRDTDALLIADTVQSSAIDYMEDVDVYRMQLQAGKGYFVALSGDGSATTLGNGTMALRTSQGDIVADSSQMETATVLTPDAFGLSVINPQDDGTYYLDVGTIRSVQTGGYRLSLVEEVGAGLATTETIAFSSPLKSEAVASTIDYQSDSDWYRVDFEIGYSYFIEVEAGPGPTSLGNGRAIVRDATGAEVSGGDPTMPTIFTPTLETSYFIDVQGIFPDSVGNYELHILREISGDFSTLTELADGKTIDSTLETNYDTDVLRTELLAGESYSITLTGDGGPQMINTAYLRLYNGAGTAVSGQYTDMAGSLTVTYTAPTNGLYFLQVGNSGTDLGAGGYELSIFGATRNGDAGANTLVGGRTSDRMSGFANDDMLSGMAGNDMIKGGSGADTIYGGTGDDTVWGGNGPDLTYLNQGDDVFNDNAQGEELGRDTVYGGYGNDTIQGGNGHDRFLGEWGDDLILGRLGEDLIYGGDGDDRLHGGSDDDTVWGGNGRDLVYLNRGNDLFNDNDEGGSTGRDTVFAGFGDDTVQGGNGDDLFYGEWGADLILGRLGNDTIYGGDQFDTIHAGDGDDLVYGGNGRDLVTLGAGNDRYVDTAQTGDLGRDTISGGDGSDVFVFGSTISADVITDFELGSDILQLSAGLAGGRTRTQVVDDLASVVGGNVVLDFGTGQSVTLQGLTSTAGLVDDLLLV